MHSRNINNYEINQAAAALLAAAGSTDQETSELTSFMLTLQGILNGNIGSLNFNNPDATTKTIIAILMNVIGSSDFINSLKSGTSKQDQYLYKLLTTPDAMNGNKSILDMCTSGDEADLLSSLSSGFGSMLITALTNSSNPNYWFNTSYSYTFSGTSSQGHELLEGLNELQAYIGPIFETKFQNDVNNYLQDPSNQILLSIIQNDAQSFGLEIEKLISTTSGLDKTDGFSALINSFLNTKFGGSEFSLADFAKQLTSTPPDFSHIFNATNLDDPNTLFGMLESNGHSIANLLSDLVGFCKSKMNLS